jgi:hypothetical protein
MSEPRIDSCIVDPLSPTAGAPARLLLIAAVLALVWAAVFWAL